MLVDRRSPQRCLRIHPDGYLIDSKHVDNIHYFNKQVTYWAIGYALISTHFPLCIS